MNLVIVESPAKAKTIEGYLGKGYRVVASYGHIRDLPKSKMGINTETLDPEYVIPTKSRKQVTALKKESEKATRVILATDEDREGEAIAWHITEALDLKNKKIEFQRIVFHEITKEAITNAVINPREINQNLVDSQQARRILDKLVGFSLSPLLWKKIRGGLSAGRVQSAALKLIVEREKEILDFKKEEYWEIYAKIKGLKITELINAKLIKSENKKIEITNGKEAGEITEYLKKQVIKILEITKSEKKRNPFPPFTTSTLQQEAGQKLGFSAKKTMLIAQKLYEGINLPNEGATGLITYMRTDSRALSSSIVNEIRGYIKDTFKESYLPERPVHYKSKKGAQEAHEAIRPTSILRTPEALKNILESDQLKLYKIIWQKTVASQMKPEVLSLIRVDFSAGKYILRANESQVVFDGFTKIYPSKKLGEKEDNKESALLTLNKDDNFQLIDTESLQKFTQPPPRYTEATLIKTLEENGVGRPSTYAPTISTLKNRRYVISENKALAPQEIGFTVNDMLTEHFLEIVDLKFTAKIEEELDEIATGKIEWKKPVYEFWTPFSKKIEEKKEKIKKVNTDVATDIKCELCSKPMLLKDGRFGRFYACSGFPDCKNTKPYLEKTGQKCPECKDGDIVIKRTKGGRSFWGCSAYPNCKWASWTPPKNN